MSRLSVLAFVVALAACGGKSKPATSTVEHSDEMHHESGLPPELDRSHERFAALYHQAPGAARTEATCGAMGEFNEDLDLLAKAAAPADVDAVAWGEHVGQLRDSVGAMGADCAENDAQEFDRMVEVVHDSFHALIELLPHAEK